MSTPMFVVLPTREKLAEKLNIAAGCEVADCVQAALDAYPDVFGLHRITKETGRYPETILATRDQVVRQLIRQITVPGKGFETITETQAQAIERVLMKYLLLWKEEQWSVNQALQMHLERAKTLHLD